MTKSGPLVAIVDDAESVRESLPPLVRHLGFAAQAFASAQAFLDSQYVSETRCVILDIAMPGMSGLELWQELKRQGQDIPTIFITASADKSLRARLMAEGAIECLFKPLRETTLVAALNLALGKG